MGEKTATDVDVDKSAVGNAQQGQRLSSGQSEASKTDESPARHNGSPEDDDVVYPSGAKVALIMISNFLAVFLVALVSLNPPPWYPL
jgi:hypothetical protein